jgi:antirestriction protein
MIFATSRVIDLEAFASDLFQDYEMVEVPVENAGQVAVRKVG